MSAKPMMLDDGYEIENGPNCWVLKRNDKAIGYFGSKRGLAIALKERKMSQKIVANFPDYHDGLK